jgi:hypothetical protein
VLADPRGDRLSIAPAHQLIDEPVAEAVDVPAGESHPLEAGAVPAQARQESQRAASGPARSRGIGGARAGPELDEVLDLQAAAAQQADHLAVAEVKLHGAVVRPLEAVHTEVRPQQPAGRGQAVLVRDSEHLGHFSRTRTDLRRPPRPGKVMM